MIDGCVIILVLVLFLMLRAFIPPRIPDFKKPSDFNMHYEEVVLQTGDGLKLSGWYVPSEESTGVIICLHGYPSNKSYMLPFVSFLYPEFSLLLFDFRGQGASEGRVTYFGIKEFMDVLAAVDFIDSMEEEGEKNIGIWGYSMGGATGISAAYRSQRISAIVTDSSFANFSEMIPRYYNNLGPLKYLFAKITEATARYILKMDFTLNSPEYFVHKINSPILIIHSRNDGFVPYENALKLYNQAEEPKRLYTVEGGHLELGRTLSSEYQDEVRDFFHEYLINN